MAEGVLDRAFLFDGELHSGAVEELDPVVRKRVVRR